MNQLAPGTVVRTVSEFTDGLGRWFENQSAFRGAAISGEISALKEINGGHLSFTLKDRGAALSCIIWQSKVRSLPPLRSGVAVIAIGNVRLRAEQSSYQMIVDAVHMTGIGELYAKFEELKRQFRLEGLFEPGRKRKIPPFIRRVALISAQGSKASEDFLQTIRVKAPFVQVEFVGTRVQGVGAEIDIREAFDKAQKLDVDVIVLTRGGGAYDELFTFNEEPVIRAIVRSRHPVITAIGHQDDHHLADEVADATYGTPSKAAEAIAHVWVITRDRIARAERDLRNSMLNLIGRRAQKLALSRSNLKGQMSALASTTQRRLNDLERRLNAHSPTHGLGRRQARLTSLRDRLNGAGDRVMRERERNLGTAVKALPPAWQRYMQVRKHALDVRTAPLRGLDPHAPLERGYAMIYLRNSDTIVRDAAQVAAGDEITAKLGRGTLVARVEGVGNE